MRGEPTDRFPCGEFYVSAEFLRAFFRLPDQQPITFEHHSALVQELDLDIASVALSEGWGALEKLDTDRALELITRWRAAGDHFLLALIDGPFSTAVQARGFNFLLHYVRGAPHVARDLFRQAKGETEQIARALRDAGVDGVILGEDIAYNKNTFIAPTDLRDLYFPSLLTTVEAIHDLGLVAFFHSDGNLTAVLRDLADCRLDGIHSLEADAGMSVSAARAEVGPALTLWGNTSFDFMSAPRSEEEIRAHLRSLPDLDVKFIFGSSSGLVHGMNPETVRHLYRTLASGDHHRSH